MIAFDFDDQVERSVHAVDNGYQRSVCTADLDIQIHVGQSRGLGIQPIFRLEPGGTTDAHRRQGTNERFAMPPPWRECCCLQLCGRGQSRVRHRATSMVARNAHEVIPHDHEPPFRKLPADQPPQDRTSRHLSRADLAASPL